MSFLLAAIGLMPALGAAALVGLTGRTGERLVALQFAATTTSLAMVFLSVAFDQPSLVDLGLTLTLLSLPGTLVLTHFLERWL